MIKLIEAGEFPFDGTWTDFRPDPAWPVPRAPGRLGPPRRPTALTPHDRCADRGSCG